MSRRKKRSKCPLNYGLEQFGDPWSLLIIRDLILYGPRSYRQFLTAGEGISTNILAERLRHLARQGFISARRDKHHSQRRVYQLTARGIDLLPVILAIGLWADQHGQGLHSARQLFFGGQGTPVRTVQKIRKDLLRQHGVLQENY